MAEVAQILVIEREERLGGIIVRLFAGRHVVTEATNWSAAMGLVAAGARFDAIVCDVPDGRAVQDDLPEVDVEHARRVIVLAVDPHPDAMADRLYRYVAKPFSLDQLRDAIAAMLAAASPDNAATE